MPLYHKINRYKNLICQFSNWPRFLFFKIWGGKTEFNFKTRSGMELKIPIQFLVTFKEVFLDDVYFQGLPKDKLIRRKISVIDVGANVGLFGLRVFSKYPHAQVFSFEPMPFNYRMLKDHKAEYPAYGWRVVQKALAGHHNGLKLYSTTLDEFTTIAGVFETEDKGQQINVPTITLAEVMEAHSLERLDLLKLDCEGSEYDILYSTPRKILDKINLMCLETHPGKEENENHHSMVNFVSNLGMCFREQTNRDRTGYIWAWRK